MPLRALRTYFQRLCGCKLVRLGSADLLGRNPEIRLRGCIPRESRPDQKDAIHVVRFQLVSNKIAVDDNPSRTGT